jgi:fibronectin type 3 domain-containing protein
MNTHHTEPKESQTLVKAGSSLVVTISNPCLRDFRRRSLLGVLLSLPALIAGSSLLAQTQIGAGFDGLKGTDTWWSPNDPNAAVGPNHVVQIINGVYCVYDKKGATLLTSHVDYLFTNINSSVSTLDPNITYDDIAGRWIIEANGSSSDIVNAYLAVSDTSDPTQGFTEVHSFNFPAADDGSKAGFNAEVVVICATSGMKVIDKSTLLDRNNATVTVTYSTTSTYGRAARMHGSAPGGPMFWTAASGGLVRVTRMDNVLSGLPTINSYNVAGSSGCTDPATPAWRNNSLVTANTGATYWWQVDTSVTPPTLMQQGLISAPSGYTHGYGSANIAPNRDMGLTYMEYSANSTAQPVSMFVAWRAAADALNTMRTPIMAVSSSPLVQTNVRHGDFSSTVCDIDTNGVTLNTFWACNGYIKPNGSGVTEASWLQNFGGVPSAPAIIAQPKDSVQPPGGTATFSVQASGVWPLSYRWNNNGVAVPGATNAAYTITGLTTNNAGSYTVLVTNSLGNTLSAAATLTVAVTPTGDWKFNDGSGTVAADSSGNAYNGTVSGSGATWVPGYSGTALQFNGVSNWIAFGTGPSVSGTNNFTVAAWIKTTAATAGRIIQQRDGGFNGEYMFTVNASGTLQFTLYGDSAYQFDFPTTATVNNGAWHHVVAVRNGAAGTIYIDGAQAATASGTVHNLAATIGTYVGRDVRDKNNNFNGIIDEVRLYNSYGMSASEVQNLYNSYLAPQPPPAPTGLTATGSNAVVDLHWTQSTGTGITQNKVYRSTTGSGGPYNLLATLAATTSYSDTAVVNGNTYFNSVTAVNGSGESALSAYAGATPGPPAAPTGLSATAGNNQVALSWTASSGATSYNVKRATVSGGPYTTIASPTTANYTDTTAVNGTTYYYVVSAVNGSGESANSSQVSATPSAPSNPNAPTNLTASAGRKKMTLTWTQSTSPNITSNNVYRATVSGGPYTLRATIAPATSYTDTGLTSGRTYYYVATAVNSSGLESPYSNQTSATAK